MAKFKIIVSDPEKGESQILELEGPRAVPLVGRRLGEVIDGTAVGIRGHKLRIAGGSDKDGFPMRPDIHGGIRTRVIITEGVGFRPSRRGERRRKTLRGSVITEDIVQINMKIVEKPKEAKKGKKLKPEETKEKPEKSEAKEEAEEATSKPAETAKPKKAKKPKDNDPKATQSETEEEPGEAETGG